MRDSCGHCSAQAAPLLQAASPLNAGLYHILRLQTAYTLGDLTAARHAARDAGEKLPFLGGVFFWIVDYALYDALTAVAVLESADGDERAGLLTRIDHGLRELESWAELCPENVLHKARLLAAEIAALEGRPLMRAACTKKPSTGPPAKGSCRTRPSRSSTAAADVWRIGLRRAAEAHLADAMRGYLRWGATAKVRALAQEFPRLAPAAVAASRTPEGAMGLDVVGLLRAAEALAREVELPRVLERLMRICLRPPAPITACWSSRRMASRSCVRSRTRPRCPSSTRPWKPRASWRGRSSSTCTGLVTGSCSTMHDTAPLPTRRMRPSAR